MAQVLEKLKQQVSNRGDLKVCMWAHVCWSSSCSGGWIGGVIVAGGSLARSPDPTKSNINPPNRWRAT